MPRLASLAVAVPPHRIGQDEARRLLESVYAGEHEPLALLRILERCGVRTRHLAFPPEHYLRPRSFEARNREFVEKAVELAADAARDALARGGGRPDRIDHLVVATTTGLATPSLDALLVPRLGLRPDVRRWPLFGLGCAGGVGAVSRAADLLRGAPGERALVVAVELCGQVFSHRARSAVDVVGVALFGDGAAAAVVSGDAVPDVAGPRLAKSGSRLFPGSEHLMGWAFTDDGLRLVLSESISDLIRAELKEAVAAELRAVGLRLGDVRHWALHPGGRRILEVYGEALGLDVDALRWSTDSLARIGNVASASALFVLNDLLASGTARPGDAGVLAAPGPGFGVETLILTW